MKQTIYILLGLFLTTFYACIEDKSTVAELDIDDLHIAGVKQHYSIKSLGSLNVEPTVYSQYADDKFRYEWYLYDQKQDNTLTDDMVKGFLVSEDSVLNYQVNVKSGNYNLLLKVFSEKTGLMAQAKASVGVAETNGFFILKETEEGNTDMDLLAISFDNSRPQFYADRVKSLMGESFKGKPVHLDIIYEQAFLDPDSLAVGREFPAIDNTFCVTTDAGDMHFVRYADFLDIMPKEYMFYTEQPSLIPYRVIRSTGYYVYLFANTGVHYVMKGDRQFVDRGTFSDAVSGCPPASTHVIAEREGLLFMYWDQASKSFAGYSSYFYQPTELSSEVKGYDMTDLPYEMQFMGHTEGAKDEINLAVLREKDNSASYIYFLDAPFSGLTVTLDSVAKFDKSSLLNQATEFAINSGGTINSAPYLYFIVDNKFYAHSLVTDRPAEEVRLEGIGSGETITYVSNPYWKDKDRPERDFDYVIVGTQQGNAYKVYFYNIIGGKPFGAPVYTVTGKGKLKQVNYVSSVYSNRISYPFLDH